MLTGHITLPLLTMQYSLIYDEEAKKIITSNPQYHDQNILSVQSSYQPG